MIKITQEFEREQEAANSLKTVDYWCSLFDLDEWLREQVKYNNDLSVDEYDTYDRTREKLRDIMDRHGVNLMDYT